MRLIFPYQQAIDEWKMGENQHVCSVDISSPVHQSIYRVNIWIPMWIHSSFGFELLKYVLSFIEELWIKTCYAVFHGWDVHPIIRQWEMF